MRIAALALAALLSTVPDARAQLPPSAATPDEATRTAARQLGERLNFTGQAQAAVGVLRNQLTTTFARASGKPPEEAARGVDEIIMPDFAAVLPELVTLIVDAWASTFTADELRELRRFYATPVGLKLQRNGGAMAQLVGAASRTLLQGVVQRSLQAHDGELRARGLKN